MMAAQRATVGLAKGAEGTGSNQYRQVRDQNRPAPPTLAEARNDKHLADRARKYVSVPEAKFEGILADRR